MTAAAEAARGPLVVLGAGPMGLGAAWMAARRGFDVTVLERGRLGESLRSWGTARLFTPLDMNLPPGLRDELPGLPPGDALLTGAEMIERVLAPLAASPRLRGRVREGHEAIAVGRDRMTRRDHAGHPIRHERPFRILARGPGGEYALLAGKVLDATGAYALPAWAGPGGLPAPGERDAGSRILRRLGDLEGWLAGLPAGTPARVLVLGHGHSAAHALAVLAAVRAARDREVAPGLEVTWMFRSRNRHPLRETPGDPLPGRAAAVAEANRLAAAPPPWLAVRRAAWLAALEPEGERLRASAFAGAPDPEPLGAFDAVAAFTGSRPDLAFLSELALDLDPSTEGAGRLRRVLCGATDCLSVPRPAPADLASGEPGFHLIGAKAYGRSPAFLLKDGLAHVEMILDHAPL